MGVGVACNALQHKHLVVGVWACVPWPGKAKLTNQGRVAVGHSFGCALAIATCAYN